MNDFPLDDNQRRWCRPRGRPARPAAREARFRSEPLSSAVPTHAKARPRRPLYQSSARGSRHSCTRACGSHGQCPSTSNTDARPDGPRHFRYYGLAPLRTRRTRSDALRRMCGAQPPPDLGSGSSRQRGNAFRANLHRCTNLRATLSRSTTARIAQQYDSNQAQSRPRVDGGRTWAGSSRGLSKHDETASAGRAMLPISANATIPSLAEQVALGSGAGAGYRVVCDRRMEAGAVGQFSAHRVGLHATWLINSATHMFGRRRFDTRDDSRNSFIIAQLTFGEGWHNNHHANPVSVRHGLNWYELDPNWIGIGSSRRAPSCRRRSRRERRTSPSSIPSR